MISKEEVRALAELARLQLQEGEVESFQKDISTILDYVGQVSTQGPTSTQDSSRSDLKPLHNVMREDVPNTPLGKRDELLAAFPKREGDYNVVRKIIQKDE